MIAVTRGLGDGQRYGGEAMEPLPLQLLKILRLLAAREASNGVPVFEIVQFAQDVLDQGIYDDLLLAIVDATPLSHAEVIRPFVEYCRLQGITHPDRDHALTALLALAIERMTDNALDPIEEFECLLREVQIDGIQRLRTLLPEHSGDIGQMMLTEIKYNYYVQDPEFIAQTPAQQNRMLNVLRTNMRDTADRVLARSGRCRTSGGTSTL